MIRIRKPATAPSILLERGREERTKLEREHDSGRRSFAFRRDIYADDSVRASLIDAQHGKCCFCESKVGHVSDGDVEHFRPKAGVRQDRNTPLEMPGYYWLAYEWRNLYFACQMCNQRNKQALFPLQNPDERVRLHAEHEQLDRERPLFIDPGGDDDPEGSLGYRDGEPFAIDDDPRAELTKRELELGRQLLMEQRWEKFEALRLLVDLLERARQGQLEAMISSVRPRHSSPPGPGMMPSSRR